MYVIWSSIRKKLLKKKLYDFEENITIVSYNFMLSDTSDTFIYWIY